MEWAVLLLLLTFGAPGKPGGTGNVGKLDPITPPDDEPPDEEAPPDPPPPKPKPKTCNGIYEYAGLMTAPPFTYGLNPQELSAANTIATRVDNGTYNTSMPGGAPCTRAQVEKLAKVKFAAGFAGERGLQATIFVAI